TVFFAVTFKVQSQPAIAATPATVQSSAGEIRVERLATLEFPWGMALLPDGGLLITEKPGRIRIWSNGKLGEPLEGVPKVVNRNSKDQGGLLGVAVDPKFSENHQVYLYYVEAAAEQPKDMGQTDDVRLG